MDNMRVRPARPHPVPGACDRMLVTTFHRTQIRNVWGIFGRQAPEFCFAYGYTVADLTGNMTTPWKYTGQSVPRGKPAKGTAAPAHPARVEADLVPISTPSRNDKDAQAGKASAQDHAAVKGYTQPTQGSTPRRLWPTAVDSADRQEHDTTAASKPSWIKTEKRISLATPAGLQTTTKAARKQTRNEHDRSTHVQTRALHRSAASTGGTYRAFKGTEIESGANNGGNGYQMIVRFFELASNTGLVVGSTVVLK